MVSSLTSDIDFVKKILPNHYEVKESKTPGSIHCKSAIGIRLPPYPMEAYGKTIIVSDAEDEEQWEYIMKALQKKFGKRFQEVSHNTCFCHVDFTIYLKQQ